MWDLIVSVPDLCLSFYFEVDNLYNQKYFNGSGPWVCQRLYIPLHQFLHHYSSTAHCHPLLKQSKISLPPQHGSVRADKTVVSCLSKCLALSPLATIHFQQFSVFPGRTCQKENDTAVGSEE